MAQPPLIPLTPTHTYTQNGNYTVTLTVTDFDGGSSSDTLVATVKKPPTLSINDISVTEGDSGTSNATFTVTLSGASSQPITVKYATVEGTAKATSDYLATNGTLTIAPGITSQTITIPIVGDLINEDSETFNLQLSDATNATLLKAVGVSTIIDNDLPPTLSVNNITVTEGDSGTSNAIFTVTLSTPSSKTVTVNYNTTNDTATAPSDYITTSGSISFTPGTTSQTIAVPIVGDKVNELTETFKMNLTNPINATIANSQ